MYAISNKNETYGEIQQCDAGFTFVDFFPKKIEPSGFFRSTTYENFRALVDRANEFLRSNMKWKIVTCESVQFKLRGNKVDSSKTTYKKSRKFLTSYIIGLRLWLTEREDEKEREQQIGYMNLIPQKVEQGTLFTSPIFENLDTVIGRFNSMLKYNPLPGRIITIESKKMQLINFEKFDPDISNLTEHGSIGGFVFFIRIFYEVMDCKSEEIGVKDFIPGKIKNGDFFSSPEFEPFSNVMKQSSIWLSQQTDLRFCNAETLEMPLRERNVCTQKMADTENYKSVYLVRILRKAYTMPFAFSNSISEKWSPITKLTCRDFAPVQLKTGIFAFKYENLAVTKERISGWVKGSGARVLSAETTMYRVKTGGEYKQGTEATFTDDDIGDLATEEDWIYIIRLYLDGVYKEPPPSMLPAVPEIAQSSCHIS